MTKEIIAQIQEKLKEKFWGQAVEIALRQSLAEKEAIEIQQRLKEAYERHLEYDHAGSMHHLDHLADQDENVTILNELLEFYEGKESL
jgi:hypothetical protein